MVNMRSRPIPAVGDCLLRPSFIPNHLYLPNRSHRIHRTAHPLLALSMSTGRGMAARRVEDMTAIVVGSDLTPSRPASVIKAERKGARGRRVRRTFRPSKRVIGRTDGRATSMHCIAIRCQRADVELHLLCHPANGRIKPVSSMIGGPRRAANRIAPAG